MARGSLAARTMEIAPAHVDRKILLLRGERVILDADIASLYGVETKIWSDVARVAAR